MSLVQGLPGYVTATSGVTSAIGLKKVGFNGPILAGKVADGGTSGVGPLPTAGGLICVQSTSSLLNQIVSTSATTINSRASFVYIPVITGNLSSAGAPPYVGCGTPLVWNDTSRRLEVWSSGAAEWLCMSSSGTFSSS